MFSRGIPRLAVLLPAIAALILVPPGVFAAGPDLCVWRHLLHLSACPACGTTRALSAFFHGDLSLALRFNRNVAVTGPAMAGMCALDAFRFVRSRLRRAATRTPPRGALQP